MCTCKGTIWKGSLGARDRGRVGGGGGDGVEVDDLVPLVSDA